MLFNYYILNNKFLCLQTFLINKKDNYIYIDICEPIDNIIKIPLFDGDIGLYYEPIHFPLKLEIIDNLVYNLYNIFINDKIKSRAFRLKFVYIVTLPKKYLISGFKIINAPSPSHKLSKENKPFLLFCEG